MPSSSSRTRVDNQFNIASASMLSKELSAGVVAPAAPKLKPPNTGCVDDATTAEDALDPKTPTAGFVAPTAPKLKPPNTGCADDATTAEDALDPKPPTAGFVAADVPKLKPLDENASVVLLGAAAPGSLNANGERF